jgi:HlyD family secretion protein
VVVTFDALPGLELPGAIAQIKQIGQDSRGEVSYTAVVQLAETDPRLRWNMTAAVDFEQ